MTRDIRSALKSRDDDVIKWIPFPLYWPFVRGIHRSPVNSPRKGQWRGALLFSSIYVWINGWVNNGEAGDLRRYRAHYDVNVMNMAKYWRAPLVFLTRVYNLQHVRNQNSRMVIMYLYGNRFLFYLNLLSGFMSSIYCSLKWLTCELEYVDKIIYRSSKHWWENTIRPWNVMHQ